MILNDSDIIRGLREGDKSVLAKVYSTHRTDFIQWMVNKFPCDADEARDIYQQVILTFYENIISEKLTELTSSLKTYLFSIGKNKFKALARSRQKVDQWNLSAHENEEMEKDKLSEVRLHLIERKLNALGEPCRSLLVLFYYHNQSVVKLSTQFGYKNVETAKNQKYKCLERLRRMVLEDEPMKTESYE